jgi:cbb3-type cytochrome oxidase subunit 1
MAVFPSLTVYRVAHLHLNLLGFLTQMIYGVSLHVVPRFFGQPIVYRRLAGAQFWLAQAGLLLLVPGFALRAGAATALIVAGAVASATAAYFFIVNLWVTINASPMQATRSRGRAVPLAPQGE